MTQPKPPQKVISRVTKIMERLYKAGGATDDEAAVWAAQSVGIATQYGINPPDDLDDPAYDAVGADVTKAGGQAGHEADTERLMHYWSEGAGAAKIRWGEPDDFYRCEAHLGKYVQGDELKGLCARLHHRAIGVWPGQEDGGRHRGKAERADLAKVGPKGYIHGWIKADADTHTITTDQRAALQPRPWSPPVRDETIKKLSTTDDGKSLVHLLDAYQNGGGSRVPRVRTDMQKMLDGQPLDPGREQEMHTLLGAINNSHAPHTLYRGMKVHGTPDDVTARYKPGTELSIVLGSFTTDQAVANHFIQSSGGAHRGDQGTRVFVKVVGDDTRALPVSNLADNRNYAMEKEWLTAGRFQVVGSHVNFRGPNGGGEVTVTLQQVGGL